MARYPHSDRGIEEIKPSWVIGENVAGLVLMVESAEILGGESRGINRRGNADYYEAIYTRQENIAASITHPRP